MRYFAGITLLALLCVSAALAAMLRSPVPLQDWISNPAASFQLAQGKNPDPVQLVLPQAQPLSAMALLGKEIFYDPSLSASGKLSCASCHSPSHSYGPPGNLPAMFGGPELASQGVRAVPSLMYLSAQPSFSIGPDPGGDDDAPVPLPQLAALGHKAKRVTKTAQDTLQSAANLVPLGGLFWDGRANTLQIQAMGPLLSPFEMDGGSIARIAAILRSRPYAGDFTALFGPTIFQQQSLTVAEALFAVVRYEIEDPSFHPYSSKYDAWLQGRASLSSAEMRGYELFNDPAKGDCAACHVDQPAIDKQPPLFTDHQFEALGLPRNPQIIANRDPNYFDLGLCGPYRTDLASQPQYCGMFLTPTLRNAATRKVFFHNGVYHDLQHVMDFYDFSVTRPEQIYPRGANGQIETFNDLPKKYWGNIDRTDPPFNLLVGQTPAFNHAEAQDIIAFLKTLDDGYGQAEAKTVAATTSVTAP